MKAFEVLHPGIHTAVQDLGRPGFMKYGIPASGFADRFSGRVANLLVGNAPGAALLEVTLFRLELLALEDLAIAVTGENFSPMMNGNPLPMWQTAFVKSGDRIAFKARKQGFRSYLAVQGGFSGLSFLGSRSVFTRGLMGSSLKAGEILEAQSTDARLAPPKFLAKDMIPPSPSDDPLRVIRGPQEDRFTRQGIGTFLSSEYRVSPQSDRMGYRLQGPPVEHVKGADIISEPIPRGAIQVPGDGLPILLLWDAQVSGGYTKIAGVISADLDRVAQIMPGDKLRFQAVALEEAHELRRKEWANFQQVQKSIENQG